MSGVRAKRARRDRRSTDASYHILVASSGDASSLGAVRVAAAIARRTRASVKVLTVANPFPHAAPTAFLVAPPPVIDEESRRHALELVQEQLAAVRGTRRWPVRAAIGWPVDAIADTAARWPASLVVLGIGEHGVLDRLIGSETAVKLARRSSAPVLAVPEEADGLPARAVAAIDFTETSIEAARAAATLIGPEGVLTLVHASLLARDAPDAGSMADLYSAGARAKLDAIRDRLRAGAACRIDAVVLDSDIGGGLLAYAERERCDLLALGGHEQSLIDRLLLGSVRTRVLRAATFPVLVVPRIAAAAHA